MSVASRLIRLGLFAVAALIGASGLLITDGTATTSAAPTTYIALAGGTGGAPAAFVNVFEPATLIIAEGDSIQWKVNVDEPHTVTFLNGGPPVGITLDNIDTATVKSPATYDGTKQIHSGFITPDPTSSYTIKFSKAGSFSFVCMIHPGMEGTVTVISAGGFTPTQANIDAEGKKAQAAGLVAAQKMLANVPTSATKSGNTWTVPTSPFAKVTGGFVAQNAFTPARLSIGAGDTVTWMNDSAQAHTVTFMPENGPPSGDPTRPTKVTSFTGGFASSGLIGTGGPPELFTGGSKYSLTFPNPGTYTFICILHADQGMAGVVVVGAAGSGGAPAAVAAAAGGAGPAGPALAVRPPATGDAGLASTGVAAWPLALVVGLLGLGGLVAMKARAQA